MAGKYPGPPATSLQITCHSARDLISTQLFGRPDPYVKAILGKAEKKSGAKKGQSCTWEESFTFAYNGESTLSFQVWDKDMISDDHMGHHSLQLYPILQQPERFFKGELQLAHKKGKPAGYLKVTIQFWPQNLEAKTASPAAAGAAVAPAVAPPVAVAPPPVAMVQPVIQPVQPIMMPPVAAYQPPPQYYPPPVYQQPAYQQPYGYPPPQYQQPPATVVVIGGQAPPQQPPPAYNPYQPQPPYWR